jgi:hypothetical protein
MAAASSSWMSTQSHDPSRRHSPGVCHHIVVVYGEPTKRKPAAVTVELPTRDQPGALRSKKTVYFSGPVLPFPSGYKIKHARL